MIAEFVFPPDPARAATLNRTMHAELASSLRHVVEEARALPRFAPFTLSALLSGLDEGGTYPPAVFASYYDLVDALLEERWDDAEAAFKALEWARSSDAAHLNVQCLGDPQLGTDSDRFARMMTEDQSLDLGFQLPEPARAAAFRLRLEEALALLRCGAPSLLGEIEAIVQQIVIVGSDPAKRMQFDGGSHYRLWGALFLNSAFHNDPLAVAEVLAHESAHSLLFGFCTQEALVENDDDELFSSPLRPDPRPMDGIYHATFVSARMHWAMTTLAGSGLLGAADRQRAHVAAASDRENFFTGLQVIASHGRLTATGEQLLAGAKTYMDTAA